MSMGRASLDADRAAVERCQQRLDVLDASKIGILFDHEHVGEFRIADREIDLLLALGGNRHAGNDDVETLGLQRWNEAVEGLHDEMTLHLQFGTEQVSDIRVEARDVAGGVSHAPWRIFPLRSDRQFALGRLGRGEAGGEERGEQ
ncbi:hypothetical protein D9M68_713020 [compost metagenome]